MNTDALQFLFDDILRLNMYYKLHHTGYFQFQNRI